MLKAVVVGFDFCRTTTSSLKEEKNIGVSALFFFYQSKHDSIDW